MNCAIKQITLVWALSIPMLASAKEPIQLRILCYNIHHAQGVDRKLDLQRIARVIRSVKPDVVALQEVDNQVKRTDNINQPAELAKLTKMHLAFGANIKLQGGHYGNAILSRFPITYKNHLLPNLDQNEQRGVLAARIKLPDTNQEIIFLATHLAVGSDNRERLASAKFLNTLTDDFKNKPIVLAGDLNATPTSDTLVQLQKKWKTTSAKPLPTVPVDRPTKQIDFILYRPQDRWKVIQTKVLDESTASDHRPVFAILELIPSEK